MLLVINLGIYEAVDIYQAGDDHSVRPDRDQRDERAGGPPPPFGGAPRSPLSAAACWRATAGGVIFSWPGEIGHQIPAREMPAYSATKTMQLSLAPQPRRGPPSPPNCDG